MHDMKYAVILLRYLKGYVHIRATGGFLERFLNLCYSGKINLWDVCLRDNVLTFCISLGHFTKIRPIVAKSGVKVTILKKTGLIYKYRKHSKRIGFVTGLALFMVIHLILSMFVWCVDVQGNNTVSKSEILSQSECYGLTFGTFKKGFDEIRTARNIAADYKGKITWLSVNIKGSLAVIELREDNRIIGETEDRAPCNIVADFDGVILSAETFYGDCMVKSGIGVKKGDLLINGAIINEDMSTTFYAAKGRITALHEKEISLSADKDKNCHSLKIIRERYKIGFFGFEIPLGLSDNEKESLILTERKTLNINDYNLPFYIEKSVICERKKADSQANLLNIVALEEMQNSIYKENANSSVVSKTEDLVSSGGSLFFNGKYTLIDFMGEEKPILSEQ